MKKRPESDAQVSGPAIPPPSPESVEEFESGGRLRCRVCGSPGASKRHDMLCWVCRRLKISAWKDVEKLALPE